jgi:hypothetical protein
VLGHGLRRGGVELAAVNHSDSDVSFSDLDVPDLLIGELFCDGFLRIGRELTRRDVVPGAHVAGGLRICRVDLALRRKPGHDARAEHESDRRVLHMRLAPSPALSPVEGPVHS